MKLHLRNGLRTRVRMHIIACSACVGAAAFMLFLMFGATESEESVAGVSELAMDNTPAISSVRDLSFLTAAQSPNDDDITIAFHSAIARPVELKMVSIAGRDLAKKKLFAKQGINNCTWRFNDDYKGVCYLYICSEEKASEVIKLVRN